MSTNIYNAWLVPTQDLTELTKLGNELEQIWLGSYIDAAASDIAQWPWTKKTAETLSAVDADFLHTKRIAGKVLFPLISLYEKCSTWIIDDGKRGMRDYLIQSHLTEEERALFGDAEMELLCQTLDDIFENQSRSIPGISFVPGRNNSTYMVGYGWTESVRKAVRERYQTFSYTDATDMDASDFSKDIQARVNLEPDRKKRYELVYAAQRERGDAWDEVFHTFGSFQFSKCGLSKKFEDPRYSYSLGLLIGKALELSLMRSD